MAIMIERGKLEGDVEITSPLALYGMATGNITVSSGGALDLHGMCLKNVVVKSGGIVRIHGMVTGDAINLGGSLQILGTVHGSVKTQSGSTVVEQGAVVVRGVVQSTGDTSQAVGLIGGAALGAAIGGPVGAIVGGLLGAILGKESKGLD